MTGWATEITWQYVLRRTPAVPVWGLYVRTVPSTRGQGALVTDISPNGLAAAKNLKLWQSGVLAEQVLRRGDIITCCNGKFGFEAIFVELQKAEEETLHLRLERELADTGGSNFAWALPVGSDGTVGRAPESSEVPEVRLRRCGACRGACGWECSNRTRIGGHGTPRLLCSTGQRRTFSVLLRVRPHNGIRMRLRFCQRRPARMGAWRHPRSWIQKQRIWRICMGDRGGY